MMRHSAKNETLPGKVITYLQQATMLLEPHVVRRLIAIRALALRRYNVTRRGRGYAADALRL